MLCANHPSTPASAVCCRCNEPVCETCSRERNQRNFCASCFEYLDRRVTERCESGEIPLSMLRWIEQDTREIEIEIEA